MKALVLGAAGLLGNAIVRELLVRDCQVTAFGRRTRRPVNLADLEVEYITGDLDSDYPIAELIGDHDAVIDAAAPYALHLFSSGRGTRTGTIELAMRRTHRLLDALARSKTRLAYIGTSAGRSSASRKSLFYVQKSFARSIHPYFSIKRRIERHLLKAIEDGVDAVIVRPSACLGPFDVKPRDQCWVPALINGKFSLTPEHRINVIDSRDVAAGLVDALAGGYAGEPIDLSGHNTTIGKLFAMFSRAAGVDPPSWQLPAELSVVPSLWAEMALAFVGRRSPLPALIPMLICEQQWVEPSRVQQELGIEPRALTGTVADTLNWYRGMDYC